MKLIERAFVVSWFVAALVGWLPWVPRYLKAAVAILFSHAQYAPVMFADIPDTTIIYQWIDPTGRARSLSELHGTRAWGYQDARTHMNSLLHPTWVLHPGMNGRLRPWCSTVAVPREGA